MSLKRFGLLGLALATSLPSFATTSYFNGTNIPIPAGLVLGDEFQLVFVTSNLTAATDTSISYYNNFVNADALTASLSLLAVPALSGITWSVLGSTGAVDVLNNIVNSTASATFAGIYDLAGNKIASDTSTNAGGLYGGTLTNPIVTGENGITSPSAFVWTGTNADGSIATLHFLGTLLDSVAVGEEPSTNFAWTDATNLSDIFESVPVILPIYAISPILVLGPDDTLGAVPEPGTLGMALIGLVCCYLATNRKSIAAPTIATSAPNPQPR
jgi:hypothetical protein